MPADNLSRDLLQRPMKAEERAIASAMRPRLSLKVGRFALPLVCVALLLYAFVLLRTAWLCDEAYLTFRTAYNLVNGFGPTWNVAERVQAFTHPLWMLLLSGLYALTREMYLTPLLLSVALSLAAAWFFAFRVARTPGAAVLGLCIWSGSRAFVDYSTSGLESPLAHLLLLVLFLALAHAWRAVQVGLLLSAVLLLRTDFLILLLPALVFWFRSQEGGPGKMRPLLLGLAPFFLWHGFALLYYGSLLGNPVVARLNTGIAPKELARQGLVYLQESIHFDPLTLPVIGLGCIAAASLAWRLRAMAIGILLYLAYVVAIGGDFMSGHLFSAPLVWAAALLIRALERLPRAVEWSLAVPVLVAGLLAPYPSLTSGGDYGLDRGNDFDDARKAAKEIVGEDGIADERAWNYRLTGLCRVELDGLHPIAPLAEHPRYQEVQRLVASGKKLITPDAVGLRGYYLGPGVHLVDASGQADPLLARLPVASGAVFRSHFKRSLPSGYEKSLEAGENKLKDTNLAGVYDALRLVTRGPLFDRARLWEIVRLNTGRHRSAIAAYAND